MNIHIKQLKDPFPFAKVADVLKKTYFQEFLNDGAFKWSEKYAKFYFKMTPYEKSRNLIFGAFKGDRLIGTLEGHLINVILDNELKLEMVNLGLLSVEPEFRRQGIAKSLLSKLIDKAKEEKKDFLMAFPQKGRHGDTLLKDHFNFTNYGKTTHLIKLMEESGIHVLRDYRKTNILLIKVAWLFSHIPQLGDPEGIIRYAKVEDLPEVVDIIKSYRARVPLSETYSIKGYQISIEKLTGLNSFYGDPWGFFWVVLELNSKILATINYRIEIISAEYKDIGIIDLPVALLSTVGFKEDLDLDQKMKFLSCVLRKIRTDYPEVTATHVETCQHEMKAFKKLKFLSDRRTYYLYMKPLTKKGEEIARYKKYKEYFLNYFR